MWRDRLVPYACALLNAGAAIALAALSPGTLAQPDAQARAAFVDQHLLAWRSGWAVWMAASGSLLLFFIWWRGRMSAARPGQRPSGDRMFVGLAIAPAAAGLACDLVGESLQIVVVPGAPPIMPLAVLLTAGVANGLYTAAGALLTVRTRLSGRRALWTWAVWAAGGAVSVAAFAGSVSVLAIASTLLFLVFCPWCIALERWLRR